jgi:hypothetical protein
MCSLGKACHIQWRAFFVKSLYTKRLVVLASAAELKPYVGLISARSCVERGKLCSSLAALASIKAIMIWIYGIRIRYILLACSILTNPNNTEASDLQASATLHTDSLSLLTDKLAIRSLRLTHQPVPGFGHDTRVIQAGMQIALRLCSIS